MSSPPVYIEFDGSSKGNPGKAGAGAVLRSGDGSVIARVRQGLGTGTNNEAEYTGLKIGLQTAKDMGYEHVRVQGDSQLIAKQVSGDWKTRSESMSRHCGEAQDLMRQFKSSDIRYVPREYNSAADVEANKGADLPAGEVYMEGGGSSYGGGRRGGRRYG